MTMPAAPATLPTVPPAMFAARHTPSGRLGQGELRRQVAAHLAAMPGDHTPGEVARALSARSPGAVANALETLAARGQAEMTEHRPRRFRATATTSDATKGSTPMSHPGGPPADGAPPASSPTTSRPAPVPRAVTASGL